MLESSNYFITYLVNRFVNVLERTLIVVTMITRINAAAYAFSLTDGMGDEYR